MDCFKWRGHLELRFLGLLSRDCKGIGGRAIFCVAAYYQRFDQLLAALLSCFGVRCKPEADPGRRSVSAMGILGRELSILIARRYGE
jgi:hypothetical protein